MTQILSDEKLLHGKCNLAWRQRLVKSCELSSLNAFFFVRNNAANRAINPAPNPARSRLLAMLLVAIFILLPGLVIAFNAAKLETALRRLGGNPDVLVSWHQLVADSKELAATDKLRRANEFFNRRIQFGDDKKIWGQSDYWATPLETLAKGQGDCEDFTIAKYFTLLSMGVPVEQLRLIYVKARIGGSASPMQIAHMVLAYYPTAEAEPLVLDNLITDIRPASRRPDLQPVFSFNSHGIFNGSEANAKLGTGGVKQLSRWSDLLRRASIEGFD